ncbi:DUF5994 family protein [Rhodococcus rhodochrous]|uniref:DUF5994 family protein n=1 Tax=Rhodococcus rhodochrous TaxID=1829 RepID=UPI0030B8FB6E
MFEHAATARDRDAGRLGDVGEHEGIRSRCHRPMSRPLGGLVRSVAMTLHHDRLRSDRPVSTPSHHASTPPARLSLTPGHPTTGPVDGAWWPCSDDLSAELDELETLLAGRAGVLDRLTYCMTAWQPIEERRRVKDRPVRLDGYHYQSVGTLGVRSLDGTRRVLVVIPPETDSVSARALLYRASQPSNMLTADELLNAASRAVSGTSEALQSWDSEGGHASPTETDIGCLY